jgi:hypothetical protein
MTEQPYEAPTVEQIVLLEKRWVKARELIDDLMKNVTNDMPVIAKATGLSDASLLFDFILHWVKMQNRTHPFGSQITELLLAAAATKLALTMTGREHDMSAFEKDVKK